jgi:hypothetical protein
MCPTMVARIRILISYLLNKILSISAVIHAADDSNKTATLYDKFKLLGMRRGRGNEGVLILPILPKAVVSITITA